MMELATAASPKATIPGSNKPMFLSTAVMEAIHSEKDAVSNRPMFRRSAKISPLLSQLVKRQIPAALSGLLIPCLNELTDAGYTPTSVELALTYVKQFGASAAVTYAIARGITLAGGREVINRVSNVPWQLVWSAPVSPEQAHVIVRRLRDEVANHDMTIDDDIAYAVDVVTRLVNGEIQVSGDKKDLIAASRHSLKLAAETYPSISSYKPPKASAPAVEEIVKAIAERRAEATTVTAEDIPF
jgi:hypothetical protein